MSGSSCVRTTLPVHRGSSRYRRCRTVVLIKGYHDFVKFISSGDTYINTKLRKSQLYYTIKYLTV